MTMPAEPPETLGLQTSQFTDQLSLVGVSLWGSIYRSETKPLFYRFLLPSEAGLSHIHEAREWARQPPRPNLARVLHADQAPQLGGWFICYEGGAGKTLTQVLQDPMASRRLEMAARAVRAVRIWWNNLATAVLPTPPEIYFDAAGEPYLLPAPFRPSPSINSVFERPVRGRYLSPECVRGLALENSDAEDLYALAIILLECLNQLPSGTAPEMLQRTANRSLFLDLPSRLPAWAENLDASHQARLQVQDIVNADSKTRALVDPIHLARAFESWAHDMDPVQAIRGLRRRGQAAEALELIEDVLRDFPSDEENRPTACVLLTLAAELAESLSKPLEALEFLERAISLAPEQPSLCEAQLALIGRVEYPGKPETWTASSKDPAAVSKKLETILWRDFKELPKSPEEEVWVGRCAIVSRFFLNRRNYQAAADFLHPLLYEQEQFIFWRFSLTLNYAEALIGLNARRDAEKFLNTIAGSLDHVEGNRTVDSETIRRSRDRLAHLRLLLVNQPAPSSTTPPGGVS